MSCDYEKNKINDVFLSVFVVRIESSVSRETILKKFITAYTKIKMNFDIE